MLRKLTLLVSLSMVASWAHASTMFLPGVSGVIDDAGAAGLPGGANGCIRSIGKAAMEMVPSSLGPTPDCRMAYPITLPAGPISVTIDSVEIAYRNDASPISNKPNIIAYLAQNRVKPDLGPIAVAVTSAYLGASGQRFLNMSGLSIPVQNGSTYWVQIQTHDITEVSYVAVTYH